MLNLLGGATGGVSAAAGLGFEAAGALTAGFGDYLQYQDQNGINNANAAIRADQQQIQQQNFNLMTLQSNRSSLEVLRRTQQARASATAAATNQGAQFGSGLQGGLAQESDQGANNQLGLAQNLAIGRNVFNLTQAIDQQQNTLANYQAKQATGQGVAALGAGVMKLGGALATA
jgi:hypothetical protein